MMTALGSFSVNNISVAIDATPDLAGSMGVMPVPTPMLLKDGKKLASRTGSQAVRQLREFVDFAL